MIALRWFIVAAALGCALACSSSKGPKAHEQAQARVESSSDPKWIEETILSPAAPASQMSAGGGAPPVALDGDRLLVGGSAAAVFVREGGAWRVESRLVPELTAEDSGFGHSVALSGALLVVGAKQGGLFVFQLEGLDGAPKRWAQTARLDNPCYDIPGAESAHTLSLSAHTAIAACRLAVHVYAREGAVLSHKDELTPDPAQQEVNFGQAVALDGNTLVIGSPFPDRGLFNTKNLPGRAHVYLRWGGKWYPHHKLESPDAPGFGSAVGVSGDTLAVADTDPPKLPEVSIYRRRGSNWTWEQDVALTTYGGPSPSLAASGNALFLAGGGVSVSAIARSGSTWRAPQVLPFQAMWSTRVAVSARHAAVTGPDAVTIFEPSGTTWRATQTVGLLEANSQMNTMAPGNFSIAGSRAALTREVSGLTQVFSYSGSHWAPLAQLEFPAPATPGYDMGIAVSANDLLVVQNRWGHEEAHLPPRVISDVGTPSMSTQELVPNDASVLEGGFALWQDVAIVGAYRSDTAYVFRRDATGWKQEQKLSMPHNGAGFDYGRAVDVRGDLAIVGAPRALANDFMVDPAFADEPGTAYVWIRSGGIWNVHGKLAPIEGKNPSFGMTVGLLEEAAVVGAPLVTPEHAAGVHTYSLEGDVWSAGALLQGSDHGGDSKEFFGYSLDTAADSLVVGTLGFGVPSAAYAYSRAGSGWSFEQRFNDPNDRSFGMHVAAADARLVIGAQHDYPRVFRRARSKTAGAACTTSSECATGPCVDGVCCQSACDGACRSCAHDLTDAPDGECVPVVAGTRCQADPLACDSVTTYQRARTCSAAGECVRTESDTCQNNLACLSAGFCAWNCAAFGAPADELCSPGAFCQGPQQGLTATCVADYAAGAECERHAQCASGLCEPRNIPGCTPVGSDQCRKSRCVGKQGDPCTDHEHCSGNQNLHCADKVCCNTACGGLCESCNQEGVDEDEDPKRGQCLPKQGDPAPGHGSCAGTGVCKGTCSGENREECAFGTQECTAGYCESATRAKLTAYCNEGVCRPQESQDCGKYFCDEGTGQCRTSCTSSSDCADGTCRDGVCRVAAAECKDTHTWINQAGFEIRCNGLCQFNTCSRNCLENGDCLGGNLCVNNLCVEALDGGSTVVPEGGTGDAGLEGDVNVEGDARPEPSPDPADEPADSGGCDCRAAGGFAAVGAGRGGLLSLVLLAALRVRRRIRRSTRAAVVQRVPVTRELTLLASLSAVGGCEIVGGYEEFSLVARGMDGGVDGAVDAGSTDAPEGSPSSCTNVVLPNVRGTRVMTAQDYGAGCFFMDVTEVSNQQYREFLDDPSTWPFSSDWPADLASDCGLNALTPGTTNTGEPDCVAGGRIHVDTNPDQPVVCVDWCDAMTYCSWAGKTLCRDDFRQASTVQSSDWYAACSNGGTSLYPVGRNDSDVALCNTNDNGETGCGTTGACTTVPVTAGSCRNDLGVLHLSGNVSEWTSSCTLEDECMIRGGAMTTSVTDVACAAYQLKNRELRDATLGFRCCLRP